MDKIYNRTIMESIFSIFKKCKKVPWKVPDIWPKSGILCNGPSLQQIVYHSLVRINFPQVDALDPNYVFHRHCYHLVSSDLLVPFQTLPHRLADWENICTYKK